MCLFRRKDERQELCEQFPLNWQMQAGLSIPRVACSHCGTKIKMRDGYFPGPITCCLECRLETLERNVLTRQTSDSKWMRKMDGIIKNLKKDSPKKTKKKPAKKRVKK